MPGFAPLPALGGMNYCLCRCAGYDSGAGISAQPRNVFNPPPVCRWVQPVWQGLVLLVGIKQHANDLVNSMLLYVCRGGLLNWRHHQ